MTRNFSPWAQWQLRLAATEARDPMPVDGGSEALKAWRDRCRARLDSLLAPWPEPVPLDLEVLDSVDCGPYRRDRVVFDTEPRCRCPRTSSCRTTVSNPARRCWPNQRVWACVVSGYFSSWKAAHRVPWNLCGSQVLPGMLGELEHVDLGALVAPRPMLVESGSEDVLFPVDVAREGLVEVRRVYDALDAPADALVHDAFEGDHRWNGTLAYDFLEHWLGRP